MLNRLFYREERFKRLSNAEIKKLFRAFRKSIDFYPPIFYWVHKLDENYLVTGFHHKSMLRYQGFEIALVGHEDISYYRLPGAKRGGKGTVLPGAYLVKIVSAIGESYFLELQKNDLNSLSLVGVRRSVDKNTENNHTNLQRHSLNTSKFADEMKNTITKGVEWFYQYSLTSSTHRDIISPSHLSALSPHVSGLTREIDSLLYMLNQSFL